VLFRSYNVIQIDEVHLLNYGFSYGTSNEARVSFPLSKLTGEPLIFVYQRGELDYVPFTVNIGYYKRNNWAWIEIPSNVSVSSNSSRTLTANLTVPTDTPQGVYEGQIKIDTFAPYNKTIVVPVSLQVPAVVPEDFLVYNSNSTSSGRLYDSSNVNGYFDWSWRYESGDWKQWAFNLQNSSIVAAFVSSSWTGEKTDIDMFGISPLGIMLDGAVSPNLYGGAFAKLTRTGVNSEYVVLNTSNFAYFQFGTYTVLLHNVLFDGTVYPENATAKVELIKLLPRGPLNVVARSGQTVSQKFTIESGRNLTQIRLASDYLPNQFPMEFTPNYVSGINAMGSAGFTVGISIPNDIPEGVYPTLFSLRANELPFAVLVLVNVVVDNTPPAITVVSPTDQINVHGNVSIEAYASDPSGIEEMKFEVEATSVNMSFGYTSGHWTARLDTTTLIDGSHLIHVKAFDKAGNVGSKGVTVTVDNTGPFAKINSPAKNAYVHGIAEINVTGEDANLDRTELYINGRFMATWNVSGTYDYLWNTTALPDGTYAISLNVYDKANNFDTDEISIIVDNTAPVAEIVTPARSEYIKSGCNITIVAFDTNLDFIQLSANGNNLTTWNTNGVHSHIWNTSSINDARTIIIRVFDKAGTKTEKVVTVAVDNTPPSVGILTPQNGAILSGTVAINFTATDTYLDLLQLLIDQSEFNVTGTVSYSWDTTKVGDGTHVIKLVAYDRAGNRGETLVSVSTINSKLNIEANKNLYLAIGMPLGFMFGVLIAYAILKRKK